MALQDIFYIVGIVFMTVYLVLLIAIVVVLLYLRKKVAEFQTTVEEKFEIVKTVLSHPADVATSVGAAMASSALKKLSNLGKKDKNT